MLGPALGVTIEPIGRVIHHWHIVLDVHMLLRWRLESRLRVDTSGLRLPNVVTRAQPIGKPADVHPRRHFARWMNIAYSQLPRYTYLMLNDRLRVAMGTEARFWRRPLRGTNFPHF